jgi:cyclase
MFRPRIIPVILIKDDSAVKSINFKNHRYIGDPINAARLFSEFGADEIILLDIAASKMKSPISMQLVTELGDELRVPFSVGGGITRLSEIEERLRFGAERIVLNTAALKNVNFVRDAVRHFGSSTISVCVDVKNRYFKGRGIFSHADSRFITLGLHEYLARLEDCDVGEIIIQSVDRDGTMKGFDIELIQETSRLCRRPIIPLGGAGTIEDLYEIVQRSTCSGVAVGSLFFFASNTRGVLISYPFLNLNRLRR